MEIKESQESETLDSNTDLKVISNYFNTMQRPWQKGDTAKVEILREILHNASGGKIVEVLKAMLKPEEVDGLLNSESRNLSREIVEELSQDHQIRRKVRTKSKDSSIKNETSSDLGVKEFSDEESENEIETGEGTSRHRTAQKIIDTLNSRETSPVPNESPRITPQKRKAPTARKSCTKRPAIKSENPTTPSANLKVLSPQSINSKSIHQIYKQRKGKTNLRNSFDVSKEIDAPRSPISIDPEVIIYSDNESEDLLACEKGVAENSDNESEDLLANGDKHDDHESDSDVIPDSQETNIDNEEADPSFNPGDLNDTLASEDSFIVVESQPRNTRSAKRKESASQQSTNFQTFEIPEIPEIPEDEEIESLVSASALKIKNAKKKACVRKPKNTRNSDSDFEALLNESTTSGRENKENEDIELPDSDDDEKGPVTSTPKPKRPGKLALLEHLRSLIDSDQPNLTDDAVFEAFDFKETLFSSQGFVQGHCPCRWDNNMTNHMFAFQLRGTEKNVDLCSRCMNLISQAGHDENRKLFLQMVLQVNAKGIKAKFLRNEGPSSRLFELSNKGNYKWLKALKDKNFIAEHPLLSKSSCIKPNSSKQVEIELRPSAKTASKLRKVIRNANDIFEIFIKVQIHNSKPLFSLQDAKCLSNTANSQYELQTSIHDFFQRK